MKKTILNNIFLLTFLLIKNNTITTMYDPYNQINIAQNAHHQNNTKKLCLVCSKMVVSLTRHMRVHTGAKPFQCQFCETKFSLKHNCLTHEKTHTDKNPFQCQFCGKKFNDKRNCHRHEKTIHLGEKSFQCQFCEKTFARKDSCLKHETIIHLNPNLFQCQFCKKKFTLKNQCLAHENSHNYLTNDVEKKNNKKAIMTNNYQNLIELESLCDSNEMLNLFQTITHPISFNQS